MTERIAMFASVIAYGLTYIAALLVAGVVLHKPPVVMLGVLTAGGSYLTQAVGSLSAARQSPGLQLVAGLLWATTIVFGAVAAIMVVL